MTKDEIKTLGHAFFDGKVLQYKGEDWKDWTNPYCPTFFEVEWRIKPDEPKKIKFIATVTNDGFLRWVQAGSSAHSNAIKGNLILIPALDHEITLPEGATK